MGQPCDQTLAPLFAQRVDMCKHCPHYSKNAPNPTRASSLLSSAPLPTADLSQVLIPTACSPSFLLGWAEIIFYMVAKHT
jgi:hypothetical protein